MTTRSIPLTIDVSHYLDNAADYTDLAFKIRGVPKGAKLSEGTHKGHGTWKLSAEEITEVKLITPDHYAGHVEMNATITAKDFLGRTTEQQHHITLDIAPETLAETHVPEGYDIAIPFPAALCEVSSDMPGDTIFIVRNLPQDVTITHGALHPEGIWTLDGSDIAHATIYAMPDAQLPATLEIQQVEYNPATGADSLSSHMLAWDVPASAQQTASDHAAATQSSHQIDESDMELSQENAEPTAVTATNNASTTATNLPYTELALQNADGLADATALPHELENTATTEAEQELEIDGVV